MLEVNLHGKSSHVFVDRPGIADYLAFEQESSEETGKYACDLNYIAVVGDIKVVKYGNVAAHDTWGYIEKIK